MKEEKIVERTEKALPQAAGFLHALKIRIAGRLARWESRLSIKQRKRIFGAFFCSAFLLLLGQYFWGIHHPDLLPRMPESSIYMPSSSTPVLRYALLKRRRLYAEFLKLDSLKKAALQIRQKTGSLDSPKQGKNIVLKRTSHDTNHPF